MFFITLLVLISSNTLYNSGYSSIFRDVTIRRWQKRQTQAHVQRCDYSVMSSLLLWDCSAHQQPSACWRTENMDRGRTELISCRVNCWYCRVMQGATTSTMIYPISMRQICWTPVCMYTSVCLLKIQSESAHQERRWINEEDIFNTHP